MSKIMIYVILILTGLTAVAFAQGEELVLADPIDLFTRILGWARSGDWWYLFGGALMMATIAARYSMSKIGAVGAWMKAEDWRGTLFTFALSFTGMYATVILASKSPSGADAKNAVMFALIAAGGWSVVLKKLVLPLLAKTPLKKLLP